MNIINLNQKNYLTALDIQNHAIQGGYTAPIDPDGRRHPGTDVNSKCRAIFNDRPYCHHMGIDADMAVDISDPEFIRVCIERGILPESYSSQKVVTLYEAPLANAIYSKMVGYETTIRLSFRPIVYMHKVETVRHNFLLAKQRRKKALKGPSLLGGKVHG